MVRSSLLSAAVLLLTTCQGPPQPAAPRASPPAADPAQALGPLCSSLAEGECEAREACAPLWGWPPDQACVGAHDRRIFAGCHPVDTACGEAETCAGEDTTGRLLVFPSTCLPTGWSPASGCCPG